MRIETAPVSFCRNLTSKCGFSGTPGPHKQEFSLMPKMIKKSELPTKACISCELKFAWRRKWAASWAEVKYCSERCRRAGAVRRS